MGLLVDGVWQDDSQDKSRIQGGRFVRPQARYRNFVTPDGSPGPTGEGGFAAESGRYHLYVSLACPWAHRTLILRKLKKLDDVISVALHRVIVPQRIAGNFVIEVDDTSEDEEVEFEPGDEPRVARGRRR